MTATLLFNLGHHSWGICHIVELAFWFPVGGSVCPSFGATVSQLSSRHHFEICECRYDCLEQERGGSCMLPDQGYMLDVQRFRAEVLQDLAK